MMCFNQIFTFFALLFTLSGMQMLKGTLAQATQGNVINDSFSGVVFSPFVRRTFDFDEDVDTYTEQDMTIMLQVISQRFHRILTDPEMEAPPPDVTVFQSTVSKILNAAAKLNLTSSRMDVTIGIKKSESNQLNETRANMEYAWGLAAKANHDSPGTVSTLLLYVNDIEDRKALSTAVQSLKHTRNYHTQDFNETVHRQVKLGIRLHLLDCGGLTRKDFYAPSYTREVLAYVDTVTFYRSPEKGNYKEGPQKTYETMTAAFKECELRIRRSVTHKLNVFFSTSWTSSGISEGQTISNQIKYWQLMADWALQQKVVVYFYEAFDNPNQNVVTPGRGHLGWWKLNEDKMANITKYSFIEKVSDPMVDEEKQIEPFQSLSTTSIVLIALFTGVIAFVLLASAMLMLYRKVKKLRTHHLSREDYKAFMEGDKGKGLKLDTRKSSVRMVLNIMGLPYNKQQLELSKDWFSIDRTAILGTGAFGRVFKGRVNGIEKEVAFKTTLPACNVTALKGVLSEIKVLSYLGRHEHILTLIGAYTAELRNGTVYVVTELCEAGSLHTYLRAKRLADSNNYSMFEDRMGKEKTTQLVDYIDNMLRWSLEIASGMEYIASKKVVHADLAARNILLASSKLTAKISDFGLSRRMHDYSVCAKKHQQPLPWRWMSIEALRCLEFSEKSDIWAFGCTMWEIYSFGDVLYSGLSWTQEFVDELVEGLRLKRPINAPQEIYDLMIQCWHPNPSDRMSFTDLKKSLSNLMYQNYTQQVDNNS